MYIYICIYTTRRGKKKGAVEKYAGFLWLWNWNILAYVTSVLTSGGYGRQYSAKGIGFKQPPLPTAVLRKNPFSIFYNVSLGMKILQLNATMYLSSPRNVDVLCTSDQLRQCSDSVTEVDLSS
jgi:hypothetical protein